MKNITIDEILSAVISFCFGNGKLEESIKRIKNCSSDNLVSDEQLHQYIFSLYVLVISEVIYKAFQNSIISDNLFDKLFKIVYENFPEEFDFIIENYVKYSEALYNNKSYDLLSLSLLISSNLRKDKKRDLLLGAICTLEFSSLLLSLNNFLEEIKHDYNVLAE